MIEKVSKIIGEDVYFIAQYGSINYNTLHDFSDIDWRGFIRHHDEDTVLIKILENDVCVGGINQFRDMIHSMNPKGIELLFSRKVEVNQNLPPYIRGLIEDIFSLRHKIAAMDTKLLFEQYIAGYHERMKLGALHPYNSISLEYLKHAYRLINTLDRFYRTDFRNYRYAIQLEDNETAKYFIDELNKGTLPYSDVKEKIEVYFNKVMLLKPHFEKDVDVETLNYFNELIEEIGGDIYGLWRLRR